MTRPIIPIGLALLLAACSPPGTPPASATKADVVAAEAGLTAAGKTILACYAVPACASVAPKAPIKAAYDDAYTAVTAAQSVADAGGVIDLTTATGALSTLTGLLAKLPAVK